MKKVKFGLLYVTAMITIFSCKKGASQHSPSPDSAAILTESPWKLLSYGYDSNMNGLIDDNEETIKNCEEDNTYVFYTGGSGIVSENEIVCDGNEQSTGFNWALKTNNTELDFIDGTAFIVKLTKESFIITNSEAEPVRLLFIYGHP